MTVTINGTTVISSTGGYTGDGVSFADGTPANTLVTDTSGNVSIGTSSPGVKLVTASSVTNSKIEIQNTSTAASTSKTSALQFTGTDTVGTLKESGDIYVTPADNNYVGSNMLFYTRGSDTISERARIDSSGNLLVGYSSGGAAGSGVVKAAAYNTKAGFGGALGGNLFNISWSGSAASLYIDTTNVGNISLTSDYRIKQKIETQTAPALERVMQLRPVTYELQDYGILFKADGVAREGFIAHELQTVIPSAVEGEKDAENRVQSLKLDALVSVLTKAIQEQQAIITALTARVEALEGTQP